MKYERCLSMLPIYHYVYMHKVFVIYTVIAINKYIEKYLINIYCNIVKNTISKEISHIKNMLFTCI